MSETATVSVATLLAELAEARKREKKALNAVTDILRILRAQLALSPSQCAIVDSWIADIGQATSTPATSTPNAALPRDRYNAFVEPVGRARTRCDKCGRYYDPPLPHECYGDLILPAQARDRRQPRPITDNQVNALRSIILSAHEEYQSTGRWSYYTNGGWAGLHLRTLLSELEARHEDPR